MLNPTMAGPGVATLATAGTIYEDGAEDTESNPHNYEEVAAVGDLVFWLA
jgi:hypothetical protein